MGTDRTINYPSRNEVLELVNASLEAFIARDIHLLKVNAGERSITHGLAEHLRVLFKGWDVDCEYNRDGHDPKKVPLPKRHNPELIENTCVYPDIIVHIRGSKNNLLIIEAKKSSNRDQDAIEFDRIKLRSYIKHLGYQVGLFITLKTDDSLGSMYEVESFK